MFLVFISLTFIGINDLPQIIKNKSRKEFLIYILLFLLALTISALMALGIKIPSPAGPIKELITAITGG